MSFTNYTETEVLEWLFTAGSVTRPSAWYVGLFTSAPSDPGGGTELSGSNYAREAVVFTVSGDTASNNANIEFNAATGSWGTITYAAIFDALSGGNMIAYAALSASKEIGTGDILRIPTGDLDVTLD
tara:strand:- start:6835 stop:7215 length:381 start_codon:yes stop_codon:yes gene_type:complete